METANPARTDPVYGRPSEVAQGVFDVPGLEPSLSDLATSWQIDCSEWPVRPTVEHLRLFIAAPLMLRALRRLVNEQQPLGIDRPAYMAALAAIDVAEGCAS